MKSTIDPIASAKDRFSKFVIKNKQGCWGWSRPLNGSGYGSIRVGDKVMLAHRFSYQIHNGEIGDKLVCHTCDNRTCTNPDHLFLGTYRDNIVDCILKNRHNSNKLQPNDILKIRERLSSGETCISIAREYGMHPDQISRIKRGAQWKYL